MEFETENAFHKEVENAEKLGFEILECQQAYPVTKYFDVGAFVYLAKIIEWEFPQFSVEKCFNRLLMLHATIDEKGYFESVEHRYILILRKK